MFDVQRKCPVCNDSDLTSGVWCPNCDYYDIDRWMLFDVLENQLKDPDNIPKLLGLVIKFLEQNDQPQSQASILVVRAALQRLKDLNK